VTTAVSAPGGRVMEVLYQYDEDYRGW